MDHSHGEGITRMVVATSVLKMARDKALTGLFVPTSLDSGQEKYSHHSCAEASEEGLWFRASFSSSSGVGGWRFRGGDLALQVGGLGCKRF